MPVAQRLLLPDELQPERPIPLAHLCLDALAEVAYDEDYLVDTHRNEFIDDVRKDGLAGDLEERLGLRVSVRSEASADACRWDNRLHQVTLYRNMIRHSLRGPFPGAPRNRHHPSFEEQDTGIFR